MNDLPTAIGARLSELEAFRRDLHAHPELGYQEVRTSGKVAENLSRLGLAHRTGLAKGTGVLAYLPATRPNAKTVALRGDMDALPIVESSGVAYTSETPGVMHACGHDGHTTILLGAATVLSKVEDRPNNVLFLFQPAEEGGAGAAAMIEDGALKGGGIGPAADVIFGLHGAPDIPLGELSTRTGPLMAAAQSLRIHVAGKGGHAAAPHTAIDPVVVASHLILALQTVASRNVDPLDSVVVTIAAVHAGEAHNVISHEAHLKGTLRTLTTHTKELATERIRELCEGVARAFGARITVEIESGYPVTQNHPDATETVRKVLYDRMGEDRPPVMGGEDFSFYAHEIPACFFWLGLMPNNQPLPNLHSPLFDFNDDALPIGIEAMCHLALRA